MVSPGSRGISAAGPRRRLGSGVASAGRPAVCHPRASRGITSSDEPIRANRGYPAQGRGGVNKNRTAADPEHDYLPLMPRKNADDISARIAAIDWAVAGQSLDDRGYARIEAALTAGQCRE